MKNPIFKCINWDLRTHIGYAHLFARCGEKMFKRNEIVYSPTDLTTFMVSPFASWMNRLRMEHPDLVPQADPADDLSGLLAKKGLDLEKKIIKGI